MGGLAPNYSSSFNFKFPEQFLVIIQYGGSRKVNFLRDIKYSNICDTISYLHGETYRLHKIY